MQDFIDKLAQRLRDTLPGAEAQYSMAHAVRRSPPSPPDTARQAGVLVLFYPRDGHWHIVLIERGSHNPNDRHRGQISLPGGQRDPDDPGLDFTAIRETEEEVGVERQSVQLLGALSQLYIPVSNFLVFPYVGYTTTSPRFRPQVEEVQRIIEVPFASLAEPACRQLTDIELSSGLVLREVPYFAVQNVVVWGATAMILGELLAVAGQHHHYRNA